MQIKPVRRSLVFSSVLLVISSLSSFATHAEEQQPKAATEDQQLKGTASVPPKDRHSDVSPGAVEDTLKTCLSRIPEQASVGQWMLAELTCQREEEGRTTYRGIPRF